MIEQLIGCLATASPNGRASLRAWHLGPLDTGEQLRLWFESDGEQSPPIILPPSFAKPWQQRRGVAAGEAELAAALDPDASNDISRLARARFLADAAAWPGMLLAAGEAAAGEDVRWWLVVRLVEAAWQLTLRAVADGDLDARQRRPPVARARFLVLSEPFRHDGPDRAWLDARAGTVLGDRVALARRAQQAREGWAWELDAYQARPALAAWTQRQLEEELRLLVLGRSRGWRRRTPLRIGGGGAKDATAAAEWEQAFVLRTLRGSFLPRFMLWDTWSVVVGATQHRRIVRATPVVSLLTLLAAGALLVASWQAARLLDAEAALRWAAYVALVAYLLVVVSVLAGGPELADPLCLRLPAGTAIGMIALLSLGTGWIAHPPGWQVPTLAGLIALGYLIVEARNHGAPSGPIAAGRALLVAVLGLIHAAAVAAVVLWWPARQLSQAVRLPASGGAVLGAVITGATVALAMGVFLQVLWEDTPITYPLSHLEWRGARQGRQGRGRGLD
jgi:hypothetical protein